MTDLPVAGLLKDLKQRGLLDSTLVIWGAPFAMLLLGSVIVYRVVRQRSRMPLDDEPAIEP